MAKTRKGPRSLAMHTTRRDALHATRRRNTCFLDGEDGSMAALGHGGACIIIDRSGGEMMELGIEDRRWESRCARSPLPLVVVHPLQSGTRLLLGNDQARSRA